MARVALMTAGILLADWDDPVIQGFVARIEANLHTIDFKHADDADGNPVTIDRDLAREKAARLPEIDWREKPEQVRCYNRGA